MHGPHGTAKRHALWGRVGGCVWRGVMKRGNGSRGDARSSACGRSAAPRWPRSPSQTCCTPCPGSTAPSPRPRPARSPPPPPPPRPSARGCPACALCSCRGVRAATAGGRRRRTRPGATPRRTRPLCCARRPHAQSAPSRYAGCRTAPAPRGAPRACTALTVPLRARSRLPPPLTSARRDGSATAIDADAQTPGGQPSHMTSTRSGDAQTSGGQLPAARPVIRWNGGSQLCVEALAGPSQACVVCGSGQRRTVPGGAAPGTPRDSLRSAATRLVRRTCCIGTAAIRTVTACSCRDGCCVMLRAHRGVMRSQRNAQQHGQRLAYPVTHKSGCQTLPRVTFPDTCMTVHSHDTALPLTSALS